MDPNAKINDETLIQYILQSSGNSKVKVPVIKALLNAGANPCQAKDSEFIPLYAAVKRQYVEIVKLLLEKGAKQDIHRKSQFTGEDSAFSLVDYWKDKKEGAKAIFELFSKE